METVDLTVLHKRRRNIDAVATRCREFGYPFLTWPEDKALLTLADLPKLTRVNFPPAWKDAQSGLYFVVYNDEQLRDVIRVGRAYSIRSGIDHIFGAVVVEYMVQS